MEEYIICWENNEHKISEGEQATVGRNPGSEIHVADRRLSREHARFVVQDGILTVEDLGSSNGTLVNNKLASGPMRLKPKDTIVAGPVTITVLAASAGGDDVKDKPGEGFTCPECGFVMEQKGKFCPGCGKDVDTLRSKHACRRCGGRLVDGAVFCPGCGESIKEYFAEEYEFADITPRVIAGVIDGVIGLVFLLNFVAIPVFLAVLFGPGLDSGRAMASDAVLTTGAVGIVVFALVASVFFGYMWGIRGMTPGMKFTGISLKGVTDRKQIGFLKGVVRLVLFACVPGWPVVFFSARKQALHDVIVRSYVSK